MSVTSSSPQNDPIESYIKDIQEKYQKAQDLINDIENKARDAADKQNKIDNNTHHHGWWIFTNTTYDYSRREINQFKQDIIHDKTDIAKDEAALEKLDPSFKGLDNAINSIINDFNISGAGDIDMSQELAHIKSYMSQICLAMKDKLHTDMDMAILQGEQGANLSTAQMEALAQDMIASSTDEQNVLNNFMRVASSDDSMYDNTYNSANEDQHSYNILQEWFGGGAAAERRDRETMKIARAMQNLLSNMISNIAPETATVMPEFVMLNVVLDEVMRKIEKIVQDPSLNPQQKTTQILALVMFMLGFLDVLKSDVESRKAKNDQDRSQATLDGSQKNINAAISNQKIMQEEIAIAAFNKMVMVVVQAVMTVVFTALAPGVGTALLMAAAGIVDTLATAGVIEDPATAISKAFGTSKLGGDLIWGGFEMVVTMGGGAAMDKAISMAAEKAAASAAKVAVSETFCVAIKEAAEQAAKAAGKEGSEEAIQAASKVITQAVKESVESTVKTLETKFWDQAFGTLVAQLKTGTAKATIENATKEAAEEAISSAANLAKLAAEGVEVSESQVTKVAEGVFKDAVNKATNAVEKGAWTKADYFKPWKWTEAALDKLPTLAQRGLATAMYAAGSTNLFVDWYKATHNDKNTDESLLTFISIAQGLMQMLAFMAAGGGTQFTGTSTNWMRITNLLQAGAMGGQAAASYGQYQNTEAQADTVKAITEGGAVADMLHQFLEQIQKEGNLSRNRNIQDISSDEQNTNLLKGHTMDGWDKAVQVLMMA